MLALLDSCRANDMALRMTPTEERVLCTLLYTLACRRTFVVAVQARTLMVLAHAFYKDTINYIHVHNFNHDPSQFDYNAILRELGHDLPPS